MSTFSNPHTAVFSTQLYLRAKKKHLGEGMGVEGRKDIFLCVYTLHHGLEFWLCARATLI